MVFKLWLGILRRESQPDIIARFQIFLQIFLALEPLNGAGGNVTQTPGLEWVSRGFTVMSPCVTVTR